MTPRQLKIYRAVLELLATVPEGHLLPESTLRADVGRMVLPAPFTAEIDEALRRADIGRALVGVRDDEGAKYEITSVGRAWLAQHS